jgi:beta-glucosidase
MAPLSLEQKAALVVGSGYWATVDTPGIPVVTMNDGPHGMRTQPNGGDNLGLGSSLPATCYPPATGLASSWDRSLVERVGRAIAEEAIEQGVDIVLGPGVNIKRSPLCGRNFEYFSEDPLVSGELGAAWVRGVQGRGVGASLKHFAANNQETARMTVSAEVDERTLREIYLPAFETIVTREKPWTVMCAYNRVNGVAAAENRWLLTEVLRDEWGFDGVVVSDWGAVDQRVPALEAGLDLEMPGPQRDSTDAVVEAVLSGRLDESVLDIAVERIARLSARAAAARDPQGTAAGRVGPQGRIETTPRQSLAREAACDSMVLLRNEGDLLPIGTNQSIAVIGEFARTPRFQGSGSSQVNPTRVDAALPSLEALAPVEFAAGYTLDGRGDPEPLIEEAVRVASRADTVLLFVGLTPAEESEGFDRTHIDLPPVQQRLIRHVAAANPRTVVILSNGGVVTLEPWHDEVPVILETWLLGQAGGAAVADVVFGRVAPSGRLAESIPFRLQDTPSYLNFPGENNVVRYGEGVFVGYRYYESADLPVRYPFGFGLGYTTFELSDLRVVGRTATVTVTNTGQRAGRHVVQLYVSPAPSLVSRPRRELRGFEKVTLEPGESTEVSFELGERAFAHWDVRTHVWIVPGGEYLIEVGNSAHDIVLTAPVKHRGPKPGMLTLESSVGELLAHPVTGPILSRAVRGANDQSEMHGSLFDMVASVPIRRLMRFPGVGDSMKRIGLLLAVANNPVIRTVAGWFRR